MARHGTEQPQASQGHLVRTLDALTEGVVVRDHRGGLIDCNPAALRILGVTLEQLDGRRPLDAGWEVVAEDGTPGATTCPSPVLLCEGSDSETVLEIRKPDGERVWIAVTVVPFVTAANGEPDTLCTFRDITARKRAEAAEHEAQIRLEVAARAGDVGFWDWDLATNAVVFSDEWKRQLGYEPGEIGHSYEDWESRLHPDDQERAVARVREYLDGRSSEYEVEFRLRHKDGSYRWILARGKALRDQAGRPTRLVGSHVDVTAQHLTQDALRQQKQGLQLAVELASLGYWDFDPATRRIVCDDGLFTLLRTTAAEQGGAAMPLDVYQRTFIPEDSRRRLVDVMNQALASPGTHQTRQIEHAVRRADGTLGILNVRFVLIKNEAGRVLACRGVCHDISEPKRAEARLTRLLEGESLLAVVSQRFIEMDLHEFDVAVHEALKGVAEFVGAVRAALFIYSADRSRVPLQAEWSLDPADPIEDEIRDLKVGELGFFHGELSALRPVHVRTLDDLPVGSRERRYAQRRGFRPTLLLPLARQTRLVGVLALYGPRGAAHTFDDDLIPLMGSFAVSLAHAVGRRNAEEERRLLERQLFQSQKLEAIGTMAGGIAHDFNNILTAIVGNLEIARLDAEAGAPLGESLDAIETAAQRAIALVQQILAFSRHQQHEHRVVSLPEVAAEAIRFVRATIPAHVAIELATARDVPPVLADPTQMHQILINLCANAWHAMDGGPGRIGIRIEPVGLTHNDALRIGGIRPGEAVRLTVSDNGSGMNDEQLKRIFEPFFTTKPVGKGTGLGMSVVLGIVQSHGGGIAIESGVGRGTSVHVYIPAARDAVVENEPSPAAVMGRGERLLLLDDERAVATVVAQGLERLGYHVRMFTDVRAALAALEANPRAFDLVIADYEMPEATGLDVTRTVRRLRPELPVIVWSGRFAPDIHDIAQAAGVTRLVTKPCEPSELSRIIGDVLRR